MKRLALSFCLGLVGCAPQSIDDAPCPPAGTTLSYESFAVPFFNAHCNHCHGGKNAFSSRSFGTAEHIRDDRERIFATAAGDNTSMPPGPDDPSPEERQRLAEWLACGAP